MVPAIAAAFLFILLASYRVQLPGLYMDEVDFVNAAQGGHGNTMIHMRLGPIPVLIMPYLGALKAWLYAPIFALFGVSAASIRLPAILLAGITLLIVAQLLRGKVGILWSSVAVWIMAVDPANILPSRVDWGPTVLMHFFQAAIFALWLSYLDVAKMWKIVLIFVSAGLGFFDKFNFIWLILAFGVGILLCYPDRLKNLWVSCSRSVRWAALLTLAIAVAVALLIILRVIHQYAGAALALSVRAKWQGLLSTLSGVAVAFFIFGNGKGFLTFTPFWLIVTDCCLAVAAFFSLGDNVAARSNRKIGVLFLLTGVLIFLQIIVTPQAGGPHHYSMILPLPLLTFVFFAQPMYTQIVSKPVRVVAAILLLSAAMLLFGVNIHNTVECLSAFRNNSSSYNARLSPEIYALSRYVNANGPEVQRVVSIDWGLHNQLHALAPRKLRPRMHDSWPTFKTLDKQSHEQQTAILTSVFPKGRSLAITFAASKETFPETRRNFLAVLPSHSELKSRLVKDFRSDGETIYEVYEIDR
jgi:hypothetical protein